MRPPLMRCATPARANVSSVRGTYNRSRKPRVTSERANIDRRNRRQETETPTMSEADYIAHLTAGGAANPETEKALGLG